MHKPKLKRLTPTACFAFGVAGGAIGLLGAALLLLKVSEAQFARTGALVLYGVALLLLATLEKGPQRRGRRVKLLLLFFALLLGGLGLPLLDLLQVLALPGAALMYREKGDAPWLAALLAFELADGAVRLMAVVPRWLGPQPVVVIAAGFGAVSLARGMVLLRLALRYRGMKSISTCIHDTEGL